MFRASSRAAIAAASLALIAAPALAAGKLAPVKVSPAKPHSHTAITLTYKVTKPLPSGWHWEFSILAGKGSGCAFFVSRNLKQRGKKGHGLSTTFRPHNDGLGSTKWCTGKSIAAVFKDKNGDRNGHDLIAVAEAKFRIYP